MLDLLFGIPGKLLLAAGAFAFLSLVIWRIRRSGYNAALEKQRRADALARDISDEIDDAVAGRSPDANREELRRWSPKS